MCRHRVLEGASHLFHPPSPTRGSRVRPSNRGSQRLPHWPSNRSEAGVKAAKRRRGALTLRPSGGSSRSRLAFRSCTRLGRACSMRPLSETYDGADAWASHFLQSWARAFVRPFTAHAGTRDPVGPSAPTPALAIHSVLQRPTPALAIHSVL